MKKKMSPKKVMMMGKKEMMKGMPPKGMGLEMMIKTKKKGKKGKKK